MKSWVCLSLVVISGCATTTSTVPVEVPVQAAARTSGPVTHADAPFHAQYDLATGQFIGATSHGTKLHSDGMVDGTPTPGHAAPTRGGQGPTYTVTQVQADGRSGPTYRVKSDGATSTTVTRLNADGSAGTTMKVTRDE